MSDKIGASKAFQEAAAAHAAQVREREDRARREAPPDPAVVAELIARVEAGAVPPSKAAAIDDAAAAHAAGVAPEVLASLLEAGARLDANGRAAVVEAARRRRAPAEATTPAAPSLDVDDLLRECPTAKAQAEAVARRGLSCVDFPVLVWIAAVSAALAAKVRGLARNNDRSEYKIWPHLYVGVEAPSGAAKSWIADSMMRDVLRAYWDDVAAAQQPAAERDARERKHAAKMIDRLDPDAPEAERHAARLRRPRLLVPVVAEDGLNTPEKFAAECQASGLKVVCPDEAADFLQKFVGSRTQDQKVVALLSGWSGERFRYGAFAADARGDANPRFPDLHVVALLLLQPDVFTPKTREDEERLRSLYSRGVFPRTLIARPRTLSIAERAALELEADARWEEARDATARYRTVLRALAEAEVPGGDHPLHPREPILVPFTAEAARARRAYQRACGDDTAADGPDAGKIEERYVARLHDHAARLAICLACWRRAEEDCAARRPVDLRRAVVELGDVERGIRLCEGYLRRHGAEVAARTVRDEAGDDAEAVRAALTRATIGVGRAKARQRDVQRILGRGWSVRRVEAGVRELEGREEIRVERPEKGGPILALAVPGVDP